ncbi:unnamed protein product [Trichobilharzia regenti]|nr:unnamed protein product [Trichobilharzia regenti]
MFITLSNLNRVPTDVVVLNFTMGIFNKLPFITTKFYRRLRDLADKLRQTGGRIAVIGGGFLGSELSVSLLKQPPQSTDISTTTPPNDSRDQIQSKLSVIHAFRETVPMSSVLPPCLASAVGRFESSKGVELWNSSDVVGLSLVPNNTTTTTHAHGTVKEQSKFVPMGTVAASTNSSSERVRLRVRRSVSGIERVEEVDVDHVVCVVSTCSSLFCAFFL